MAINTWVDKQFLVHLYNETHHQYKRRRTDMRIMYESQSNYADGQKPDTEYTLYDSIYIQFKKSQTNL